MSVVLFVLGILMAAIGAGMAAFGVAVVQSAYGTTFIMAGTTVLVGGLIVIALAVAVSQLSRIAETLKARPAPRPARAGDTAEVQPVPAQPAASPVAATPRAAPQRPPAPAPTAPPLREPHAPEQAPDVSAEAIERLRASIVRPERNGEAVMTEAEDVPLSPRPPTRPAPQRAPVVAEAPAVVVPPPPAEPAPAEARKPRLDFLFRSRPSKRTESFDTVWPAESRPPKAARVEPQVAPPAPVEPAPQPVVPPSVQAPPMAINGNGEHHAPPAILKSGVVDGMAYTLYADGSIEATLPQGTVRFGSIAELRSHIEANS
jgi:hypothetical protein